MTSLVRIATAPLSSVIASRVVSNIEIEYPADDGTVTVWSNFSLGEFRRGKQDIFVGRTMHKLQPHGDSFKIILKKVLLINNEAISTILRSWCDPLCSC
jgi:3-phenylpropionate/cinnamic acid dioxygenase small subunit